METALLKDILIIYGLSVAVVYLFHRLRLPTVVGFLLTGVVAGPHGLGLIGSLHEVETLAEIGVVLLLFTIGLEFSFRQLAQIKVPLLLGGSLQVLLTVAAGFGAGYLLGLGRSQSLFLGFLASLSSTAIVLKLLQERAQVDSPQGRTGLAILIFQDVVVVVMLLITPFLAGGATGGPKLDLLLKGLTVVAALLGAARWAVPWLLNAVTATRSRELFIIAVVAVLLGVAWLTSWAGLSLALGAFLAGLIVAESPYSHQTIANIIPMRDLFTSLFFVSIGMLMDLSFLVGHPGWVAAGVVVAILVKSLTAALASLAQGLSLRVALAVGLMLSQIGEFSFILARAGLAAGLLEQTAYQLMLDVTVVAMALTPLLVSLGGRAAARPGPAWLAGRSWYGPPVQADPVDGPRDHVIVVGYGLNGRNVARAARAAGIPFRVLEMNPATVRAERARGEPIFYGDAVHREVLEGVGLARARVLVVSVADPVAVRRIVATAKALNPGLHVIARTRYLSEMEALARLGADEVIPEEFETAVEMFARVLNCYGLPAQEIDRLVAQIRSEGYGLLRRTSPPQEPGEDLRPYLGEARIATVRLEPGAPAVGRSIGELALRRSHGITALAIRRGGKTIGNPAAETVLGEGDCLVLMAGPEGLAQAGRLFRSSQAAGAAPHC